MNYIDLSPRQAAILDYIKEVVAVKGYPPTVREIGSAIGLNSPSTVHGHLNLLEQKGYIKRDPAKPRALEVVDFSPYSSSSDKEMVNVPILGTITAGKPILAVENMDDFFPLPIDFIRSNKDIFILQVSGESMIEAGILDGDHIIVEETPVVNNGEIAAVLIEDEATVKRFYKENDHIRLQPENSLMEPIIVDEVKILGRVIGLFRRF